MAADLQNVLE
jgi:hypothetical protein